MTKVAFPESMISLGWTECLCHYLAVSHRVLFTIPCCKTLKWQLLFVKFRHSLNIRLSMENKPFWNLLNSWRRKARYIWFLFSWKVWLAFEVGLVLLHDQARQAKRETSSSQWALDPYPDHDLIGYQISSITPASDSSAERSSLPHGWWNKSLENCRHAAKMSQVPKLSRGTERQRDCSRSVEVSQGGLIDELWHLKNVFGQTNGGIIEGCENFELCDHGVCNITRSIIERCDEELPQEFWIPRSEILSVDDRELVWHTREMGGGKCGHEVKTIEQSLTIVIAA